jgi:signal transduction histidine kinase
LKSIRRVLEERLLAALVALLLVSGVALYLLIRARLVAQFDGGLEAKARLLAAQLKYEGPRLDADFVERPTPELKPGRAAEYVQLEGRTGQILFRSPSLGRAALVPRETAPADTILPDDRRGRVIAVEVAPPLEVNREALVPPTEAHPPVRLVLAQGRQSLDAALDAVLAALLAVGLLVLAGLAAVVVRVVPAGLRPLQRVAARAADIDASKLDARFPQADLPAELAGICARLNDLLGRLQVSFARERRFASNVAHELRTPITELRAAAQVALLWPEGGELAQHALGEAVDVATQMDRIVSNLLTLSRCEQGRELVAFETVDLASAAREGWRPFAAEAARHGLKVQMTTPPVDVATDRSLLGQILTNLFANAVTYTPPGGEIACVLADAGGQVALTVANTTDALDPGDLPHLFEPFWRKDAARSDRDHVGLGLALVSAFTERLRIDLSAALPAPRKFAITLRFP